MASSPDGGRLAVVNTPSGLVHVFALDAQATLDEVSVVAVGMDPVAVAWSSADTLWVVNHLSDSVSIVHVGDPSYVERTLLVGDEPRDIVMARGRAFIGTAHRGQHRTHPSISTIPGAGDPELFSASVPRTDVWVFDTSAPGDTLGGTPIEIVELFGDTPRGLAVSPDGAEVYVAVLHSGNRSSVVHESVMCAGFEDTPAGLAGTGEARAGNEPCVAGNLPADEVSSSPNGPASKELPMGRPLPSTSADGENQPWTSMIVEYDEASGEWRDARGLNFSNGIRFSLPDNDVFAINTETLNEVRSYSGVGTTLFNLAVHPVSGTVYVTNTEANNTTRFEGPGVRGGSTVQGRIALSRLSVLSPADDSVRVRHLNRHIDYAQRPAPEGTRRHSLSTPLEMAISADGTTLYVAALGSNRVGVYSTSELEDDGLWDNSGNEFDPTVASRRYIDVPEGPVGLVLDEGLRNVGALFVLSRYDNTVRVVDLESETVVESVSLPTPESLRIRQGRQFLYDATRTSSNGEASCASCHVFGDTDHLAWNLGNPDANNGSNINPFPGINLVDLGCELTPSDPACLAFTVLNGNGEYRGFAALKGPMTTQTFRGMSTHGHLHWRGDRVEGYFGRDDDPDADGDSDPDTRDMETLDERLSFKNFIVAFEGLLGMDITLPEDSATPGKSSVVRQLENEVDLFADFAFAIQMPPNPIRPLDNQLSASAARGEAFFTGPRRSDGIDFDYPENGPSPDGMTCGGCHTLDPSRGFYGTDGKVSTGGEAQILKVPQLRNLYTRVGMFGLPNRNGFLPSTTDTHQGPQIRGFGFLHDGATDKLFNFLQGAVFDNGESSCEQLGLSGEHFGCDFNVGSVGVPDDEVRQSIVDYLMEFDSDLAPIVGQQMTLGENAPRDRVERVELLEARAGTRFVSKVFGGETTECDLVADGIIGGAAVRMLYDAERLSYRSSDGSLVPATALHEQAQQAGSFVTFTCHPPGFGEDIVD